MLASAQGSRKRWAGYFGRIGLLLGALGWGAAALAAPLGVTIVSGGEGEAYGEIADTIRSELGKDGQVAVVPWQKLELPLYSDVVVAVGVKAVQAVAERNLPQPVLSTLIPRSAFEKIARQTGRAPNRRFSAVYLDQPLVRQLDLIRYLLPGRSQLGVVFGPDSLRLQDALAAAARERNMRVISETIAADAELFPALQKVLEESELLLALPDALAFNSNTIQNVLLTAYRYRLPLIGFSAAYVKAGALAAVYSTPAQLAGQAAEILRHYRDDLPSPQYPKYFSVSVNAHVARSLAISIPSEAQLLEKLTHTERTP